jgi:hypothetical protein
MIGENFVQKGIESAEAIQPQVKNDDLTQEFFKGLINTFTHTTYK